MGCRVPSCLPKAQGCDHLKVGFETARLRVVVRSTHRCVRQGPRWCASARGAPGSIQESEVGCSGAKVQHPRERDDCGHPLPRDMEALLDGDAIHSSD